MLNFIALDILLLCRLKCVMSLIEGLLCPSKTTVAFLLFLVTKDAYLFAMLPNVSFFFQPMRYRRDLPCKTCICVAGFSYHTPREAFKFTVYSIECISGGLFAFLGREVFSNKAGGKVLNTYLITSSNLISSFPTLATTKSLWNRREGSIDFRCPSLQLIFDGSDNVLTFDNRNNNRHPFHPSHSQFCSQPISTHLH